MRGMTELSDAGPAPSAWADENPPRDGPAADTPQVKPPAERGGIRWRDILSELMYLLRYVVAMALMRASRQPRHPVRDGEPLYARAALESAKIEERYFYKQEISQNPHGSMSRRQKGKIELTLPHDGYRYLTRQAYADITRLYNPKEGDARAIAGYLALTGYGQTNLGSLLDLGGTYGSIPLKVLVPATSGLRDYLTADRISSVFNWEYVPRTDHFKVRPVTVDIELADPDSSGISARQGEEGMVEEIKQQVAFRTELLLRMTVRLHAPGTSTGAIPAEVTKVTVNWPTITSLRSLRLTVNREDHPVRYNPEDGCLEWSKVSMTPSSDAPAGDRQTYTSDVMELSIPEPGELYQESNLKGSVEVKVGRLLSGMEARLYSATGFIRRRPKLELDTYISTDFNLILDDAFDQRQLTSYQHLHFDEVIPSEIRISDIRIALANCGFRVMDLRPESGIEGRWWLHAEKFEGPDRMLLVLYVEGISHQATRDSQVPGGVTYRSNLDSGEMRIYVRGRLRKNSQPVIHEMNALRRALHERFDHLPARR
jgi:hypothetical protein